MDEDYFVRYGDEHGVLGRTFYLPKIEAEIEYDKIELANKITWKELIYEPLDIPEEQILIKDEERRVGFIFGYRVLM